MKNSLKWVLIQATCWQNQNNLLIYRNTISHIVTKIVKEKDVIPYTERLAF